MAPAERTQTASSGFTSTQHVNAYTVFVIMFICLSSTAYGYAGAIIATTLTQPSFNEHMGLVNNPNTEALIGAMNGLYYAGGVFGSFLQGWTSNKFGRKCSVTAGNVILLVTGGLLTASVNPAMFIVFRFFSGIGSLMILSGVPLWVAELAPPKVRGILSDFHATAQMIGYTLACYVGLGFYFVEGTNQWRGAMALQMVLPAAVLCGIYWMPESPRYLLAKGRTSEAHAIIERMHSDPNDPTNEFSRREFYQMRKQVELEHTFSTSYWEIMRQPSTRKRALITIFLEFCLMSSGILVVLNYGSIVWKGLGFNTVQILNLQGGFQLTSLVFNIVAMAFVDKMPRPRLIATGLLGVAICMGTLMALFSQYLGTTFRPGLIACAAVIFLFQIVYSLFLDGPCFFYVAEIWPSHLRPQGFAIALGTLSLTNIVWLEAAPSAWAAISWRFYACFIAIPAFGAIIVIMFFKDTLHKPLEEIAAIFGDEDMVAVYQREVDLAAIPIDDLIGIDITAQKPTVAYPPVEDFQSTERNLNADTVV